ncbi:hypothetical protein GCM10009872_55440 [Actinopolymorpha rutila]
MVEVERVVRGYDNEVYRVRLDAGTVVYPRVRLGRPAPPTSADALTPTRSRWTTRRAYHCATLQELCEHREDG